MKNKEITLQTTLPGKDRFLKLVTNPYVKTLLNEAKRVGYLITKDELSFTVNDNTTGEIVFKGNRLRPDMYAVHFSKLYWIEPPLEVTTI